MIGMGNDDDFTPVFLTASRPVVTPLGPADLEVLDELLRNNGDCDDAEAFADHVKAIMVAYERLYLSL